MLDIRLRLANDDGTTGRVLDTLELAWTGYSAQTVKFTVSEKISEKLDAPFLVIVEYTTSTAGRWKRVPRNDLFIVDEDSADSVDTAGAVSYTAAAMLPWLAARYPLWWRDGDSVDDLERAYTNRTPGFVLRDLIQVAQQQQGWGGRITFGFSDSTDSAGQPWSQRVSMAWPLFTTPLSRVMQTLAEQGYMEFWAEGYQLRAVNPGTGVDRSDTVALGGPAFSRAPASRKFDPATAIVVQYDQGWTHFNNPGAEGRFGNLFKVMTQSGSKTRDVAEKNVQPALAESRAMQEELSYEWELSGDGVPVPWESFQVGDVVTARTRRGKKVLRVIGLDVSKDSKGLVKATAVVGSKLLSLQAKLAKRSAAASVGQIIGGSGVALPPAAAPAKTAPLPPAAVRVASNVGSWGEDGSERSTVTIAWDAVSQAIDGLAVDIDTYEVWSRPVNEPMSLLTRTTALSTTVETWTPGENRLIAVRARSRAGVWSQLSPEIGVTPARPVSIVPMAPTGLAAASNTGAFASDGSATATVRLTWDAVTQATDGGLVQVVAYEVLVQDGQAWTPLLETAAREVTITVPSGKARGIRVRARTALGVWGDPSATTTVTGAAPAQVTTATSAPSLTTGLGLVLIGWDGKLSTGAAVPSSFQLLYAETAPASTGPWTRVGVPARAAGQVATVRGTAGATLFARLVWVDTLGRTSSASAASSIVVQAVASGDLDKAVTDALTQASKDATDAKAAAATADGRLTVSDAAPVAADAAGKPAGAVWFRRDTSNRFIGAWELVGGTWVARTLENAMIATLDAAKINTGFLDVANRVRANAISVRQLLVGDFTNLVEDPYFDLGGTVAWQGSGGTFVADAYEGHATSLRIVSSGERTQPGIPVKAGDRFTFSCVYKASGWPSGGAGGLRLQQSKDGGTTWSDLASTTFGNATAWTPSTVEATIPTGVTHIRARIAFAASGATVTVNGFSLRRMNGGELVIDGSLSTRKLNVSEIWGNEAWLNVLRAGLIETSMLSAGFGQNLDITANGAITLIAGQTSAQAAELSDQRTALSGVADQVANLGGQVGEVRSAADAAGVAATAAAVAARAAQEKADGLSAVVRILPTGLEIGAPGAATSVMLTPSNMTFNVNGVPGAYLDAGQFIAPRFVGEEVDLANLKIKRQGNRTVFKAI